MTKKQRADVFINMVCLEATETLKMMKEALEVELNARKVKTEAVDRIGAVLEALRKALPPYVAV